MSFLEKIALAAGLLLVVRSNNKRPERESLEANHDTPSAGVSQQSRSNQPRSSIGFAECFWCGSLVLPRPKGSMPKPDECERCAALPPSERFVLKK